VRGGVDPQSDGVSRVAGHVQRLGDRLPARAPCGARLERRGLGPLPAQG
jgi:hypothetical protein